MLQPESTCSGGRCPLGSSCPEMPFSDGGTEAWRGGPGDRIAEAEVAGLGCVSVSTEAEAVFTPITCLCRPEVTGQAGQWLEGLPPRLAGGPICAPRHPLGSLLFSAVWFAFSHSPPHPQKESCMEAFSLSPFLIASLAWQD